MQAPHLPAIRLLSLLTVFFAIGCGEFTRDRAYFITDDQHGPCGEDCDQFYLSPEPPTELNVLTYNVFLRPGPVNALDDNECRAKRIGRWLDRAGADIVALQETFEPGATAQLSAGARYAHPFQVLSKPNRTSRIGTSGGLSILSRWPIERVQTIVYDDCRGALSDCIAAKGALHAVVRVSEDARMQVVATHLDAGSSTANREARASQLAELRSFLDELDPDDGPVVTLGDFNVDSLSDDGEYDHLLELLEVRTELPDEIRSTLNCKTNILCTSPPPPERLDYVFTALGEDRLSRRVTKHLPMDDESCADARYLSDHRAVWSTMSVDW